MDHRKRIQSGEPLAESMWRDAQLTRPQFSAALHERLRAAIHAAAPLRPAVGVDSPREFYRNLVSWAVAAAASIAVLVGSALFWQALGGISVRSIAQTALPEIAQAAPLEADEPPADDADFTADLLEFTVSGLGQWMASTVGDNQWVDLDSDAETAMATVTSPLPFDLSMASAAADPVD